MFCPQCILIFKNYLLGYQQCVISRLDAMLEKQDEALSMLRMILGATKGVGGTDVLDDVLPNPISEVGDLEDLCLRIQDEEDFRKKMVS